MNRESPHSQPRVVLMFLDGIGIGRNDPEVNPFFQAQLPVLTSLCGGKIPHVPFHSQHAKDAEIISVSATLGVPGLPQSGTGQTAIFTGVNGAKVFGRHFGPHPPSVLRQVIEERNIFHRLQALGKSVTFANAFPRQFFEYIESGKRRMSVSTLSCKMSGVPLRTAEDLRRNEGVSADFIRTQWESLGHPGIPVITSEEAGTHFAHMSGRYDFSLFEYWLTDHAGHGQKMQTAVEILERFDRFLGGFLQSFDLRTGTLIIISDHGNLEDLTTKSHTRNKVPCIIAGKARRKIARSVKSLTDITPAILSLFKKS